MQISNLGRVKNALFAGALLLAAGQAHAGAPADGMAQMEQAAMSLIAIANDPAKPGEPPRIADEKAGKAFKTLLDRKAIIGEAPYTEADIKPLLGAFGGYFTLTKLYMDHKGPDGKAPFADNEFTYQTELSQLAAVMVDTAGALSSALSAEVGSKPASEFTEQRKAELAKLRSGISQMYTGALTLLQNPRYEKDNKVLLASRLADNAPAFREIIPVSERVGLVKQATDSLMQTPPEAAEDINMFMNEMKSEDCVGLCALK